MNDRIQQLAKQAHFYQEDDNYFTAAQEEFARLIVKECADWIKNTDSDPDIGEEDAKALLEHFGVEE